VKGLESLIQKIDRLPTIPTVAAKMLEIVDNPQSSGRELSRIVTSDPPLAGWVIRTVNSAVYGLERPVSSIHQAVLLLGFQQVKSLCLGVSVFRGFDLAAMREGSYRRQDFLRHSLTVGFLARRFAQAGQLGVEPDTAFAIGLLHDVGLLVKDQYLHDEFTAILACAEEQQIPYDAAEKAVGEFDHALIGAFLLREWRFNEEVYERVRRHHYPLDEEKYPREAVVVAAADWLCDRAGIGFAPDRNRPDPGPDLWEALSLPEDARKEHLALAVDAVAEIL